MSLREKSIQLAKESDIRAEAIRKEREEKEFKQVREAFNKKFGEQPDREWKSYPFFYAEKEGITFKVHFAMDDISNGIDYFYIATPEYPHDHLSNRLISLLDLGRFLQEQQLLREPDRSSGDFKATQKEEEKEEIETVKKDKPRRMLRIEK